MDSPLAGETKGRRHKLPSAVSFYVCMSKSLKASLDSQSRLFHTSPPRLSFIKLLLSLLLPPMPSWWKGKLLHCLPQSLWFGTETSRPNSTFNLTRHPHATPSHIWACNFMGSSSSLEQHPFHVKQTKNSVQCPFVPKSVSLWTSMIGFVDERREKKKQTNRLDFPTLFFFLNILTLAHLHFSH